MFKVLLYGFLLYLAYRFIFDFVVPVSKASSQMRDKLQEIQRQQQAAAASRQQQAAQTPRQEPQKQADKDYIEFEELK
jgi:hypothetical protein